jgi:hypothetical protein
MPEDQRQPPETTTIQGKTPSLAELIAQTPSAQTREQALKHIASREKEFSPRKRQRTAPSDDEVAQREPMPFLNDPSQYAARFFKGKQAEARAQQKPPKRFKLYLVPKKDKPDPADKK